MFDAPAYLKSLQPPEFIDQNGHKHVGRIIGADTWQRLQSRVRLTKREDGSFDPQDLNRAMNAMVHAMFPRPWWKVWERSVAWHLWRLPGTGRMRAVWSFMQSQASANGMEPEPLPGTTPDTLPITPPAVLFHVSPTSGS